MNLTSDCGTWHCKPGEVQQNNEAALPQRGARNAASASRREGDIDAQAEYLYAFHRILPPFGGRDQFERMDRVAEVPEAISQPGLAQNGRMGRGDGITRRGIAVGDRPVRMRY